ncbi:MAG: N-acetylmuramoyl-L-alanine amidase [Clostridia bacterium]|nr:N-acetylmuramoyl-L-alanine amidase [Clostridia bacterium]MBQ4647570.1 N-acetylmuramoyl-L-alanine amidase [Clostridia bacterium]
MENSYIPTIVEDIIPEGSPVRPGVVVEKKKYVVIHNTGNPVPTATAKAHAAYIRSLCEDPVRQVSWHYTVDDKEIYHHVPDNENAWHASDGSYGEGNFYGIGIEICVNGFPGKYEGEEYEAWLPKFKQTLRNAAYLTAKLMRENDIDIDGVKQHYDFARDRKNCPMQMRYTSISRSYTRDNGDMWRYFLGEVKKEYAKTEA